MCSSTNEQSIGQNSITYPFLSLIDVTYKLICKVPFYFNH
jgi:hypothetical protein